MQDAIKQFLINIANLFKVKTILSLAVIITDIDRAGSCYVYVL